MTCYPTTPLPPYYPPYYSIDSIIFALVDKCIEVNCNFSLPQSEHDQYFKYTMALVDFWEKETRSILYYELQQR